MLFPLSDDDRHLSSPAYVSLALLACNIALFVYQYLNPAFTSGWSVIPHEIVNNVDLVDPQVVGSGPNAFEVPQEPGPSPIQLTLLSSMFMHGGLAHIGGNMLYLWIFGDNVEHRFGHVKFLIFYLVSGLAASAAQIAMNTESVIPNLGASGAISGVLGAYLVLFPRNKVNAVFFVRIISVPAFIVLGMWIIMQLFSGAGSLKTVGESGGVAYAAHIGGFIAGVVMGLIARAMMKEEPDSMIRRQYDRDHKVKRLW